MVLDGLMTEIISLSLMPDEIEDEDDDMPELVSDSEDEDDDMPELASDSEDEGDDDMPELISDSEDEDDDGMPELASDADEDEDEANQMHQTSVAAEIRGEETALSTKVIRTDNSRDQVISDSGATSHMMCNLSYFKDLDTRYKGTVRVGNGEVVEIRGKGKIRLLQKSGKAVTHVEFRDALYVPDLFTNLFSVGQAEEAGWRRDTSQAGMERWSHPKHPGMQPLVAARENLGHYMFKNVRPAAQRDQAAMLCGADRVMLAHRTMAHIPFPQLKLMVEKGILEDLGLTVEDFRTKFTCDTCTREKMKEYTFRRHARERRERLADSDDNGGAESVDAESKESEAADGAETLQEEETDIGEMHAGRARQREQAYYLFHEEVLQTRPDKHAHPVSYLTVDLFEVGIAGAAKERYGVCIQTVRAGYGYSKALQHRHQAPQVVIDFIKAIEAETGSKVKCLTSDGAGEFRSQVFEAQLQKLGVQPIRPPAHAHQLNGHAEAFMKIRQDDIRTLMGDTRGLMKAGSAAYEEMQPLWPQWLNLTTRIRNLTPSMQTRMSPTEIVLGKAGKMHHPTIAGSLVYGFVQKADRQSKLERTRLAILCYWEPTRKGYLIWDGQKFHLTTQIQYRDDTSFQNARSVSLDTCSNNQYKCKTLNPRVTSTREQEQVEQVNSRAACEQSSRETQHGEEGPHDQQQAQQGPRVQERIEASLVALGGELMRGKPIKPTSVEDVNKGISNSTLPWPETPRTVDQAETDPVYGDLWRAAIEQELEGLERKQAYEIIRKDEVPEGTPIYGIVWAFAVKTKNGRITRFKARAAADGSRQQIWDLTSSPVIPQTMIRTLLAIAAAEGYKIDSADFVAAYLNAELKEPIYTRFPVKSRNGSNRGTHVLKLTKALYGLKQAGRLWYEEVTSFLAGIGLRPSKCEPCCFTHLGNRDLILGIYVDDLVILWKKEGDLEWLIEKIKKKYELEHLGKMEWILGMKVEKLEGGGYALSQEDYIESLAERFMMEDAREAFTPLSPGLILRPNEEKDAAYMKTVPFMELAGSVLYVMVCTRPDINMAISMCCSHSGNYNNEHWSALLNVLRYLITTKDKRLYFANSKRGLEIAIFVDAAYATCPKTRKSRGGLLAMIGGRPILWKSKVQGIITLSSTEAEYIQLAEAAKTALYLFNFMKDIKRKQDRHPTIFEDNQASIHMAENDTVTPQAKHIQVRYHFIREVLRKGLIRIQYIQTKKQLADLLTKIQQRPLLEYQRARVLGEDIDEDLVPECEEMEDVNLAEDADNSEGCI